MPIFIRESHQLFFPQMLHEELLFPAILSKSGAAETSWGGWSSRQTPRVLLEADFFPQLVADWGQAFHNMDFVV